MLFLKMTAERLESVFGKYWWALGVVAFFGLYLAIIAIQVVITPFTAISVSAATPSDPQGLILTAGDTEVSLNWSLPADNGAQANWYNSNWLYRKPLTISSAMVSGGADLTDFPVLVNVTDADLIGEAQIDADDILFTQSDGTTKLDHEIEFFDSATGELQAWIRIPTLSASIDTDIFIYYSNAGAVNQENVAALWPNYEFVYHFGEGSGSTIADSSPNGYDLTLSDTGGWVGGEQIGNAFDFTGRAGAKNATAYSIPPTGTMSTWFNLSDNLLSGEVFFTALNNGRVRYVYNAGSPEFRFETKCWGIGNQNLISGFTFSNSQWYYVASESLFTSGTNAYDFNNYLDGSLNLSVSDTCGTAAAVGTLNAGNDDVDSDDFPGSVDEIRFTNDRLSADWVATEYENQANNATHISSGTQEQYESGVITDYVIEYRVVGAPSYTVFSDGVSAATSGLVTGLTNGVDYEFRVSAVNSTGTGTPTASQQSTPSGVPLAVADLAGSTAPTQIDLNWTAPNDNGSTITDYVIEYKESALPTYSIFADGVSVATTASVTGLSNGTSYDFRIAAVNAQGQGAYSNIATATPQDVPAAIGDLAAVGDDTFVDLSWSAPFNNGNAITDYIIEYKESALPTYNTFADGVSTATAVSVTGLTNGTAYDFRVSAVNGIGQGAVSNVASATPTPAATVPGAVQNLAGTAGEQEVVLTWNVPASDGGDAIIDYVVSYKETSMPGYTSFSDGVSATTGATVTGLTEGVSYDFRVAAVNGVGTGPNSDISGYTPYRTLTNADIPGLTIVCTDAEINTTTTCGFTLPTYIVLPGDFEMSIGAAATNGGCSRAGANVTCSNVPTGSSVGSQSIYGWTGAIQTDSGETVDISTIPSAVQNLAGATGEGQVVLTWDAPANDGGRSITDYIVGYKESTAGAYNTFVDGVSATTGATVTGLTAGISYDFRVAAINGNGTGPYTVVTNFTPYRTLTPSDVSSLSFSCNSAPVNSTTSCNFALVSHVVLPADFQISIGSASAVGGCTRAGNTVTCNSVPTGSNVGDQAIYGWTSSTQTDSGETVSITAVSTSSSATSSSTSSTSSAESTTSAASSSTTTDIPVDEETPLLTEDDLDETQIDCDEVQQAGTTNCEIQLPDDVAPPVLGIKIKIGEDGTEKECVYDQEDNTYKCYDVPVGDIIGSIPIFVRIGSGDLINTAARVIVRSVLAAIDYKDIAVTVITDDGNPAVGLLEEFIVRLQVTNNTEEIQTRLKLTQLIPSQIAVVDGSLTSLNQVLPDSEIRVALDNTLSTGEFNLSPGQTMGIEYRARLINADTLQLDIYAQLQSNLGLIRSESVELLVLRSNDRIWWLFIICILLVIVGAGIAIYLYIKSKKGKE